MRCALRFLGAQNGFSHVEARLEEELGSGMGFTKSEPEAQRGRRLFVRLQERQLAELGEPGVHLCGSELFPQEVNATGQW